MTLPAAGVSASYDPLFVYDPSIGIADAATALGVVGAAAGYIISLIRAWRTDWRNTRYRGTRLTILELLEQALPEGMAEKDLRSAYSKNEHLRRKYTAWDPEKLDDVAFERELKQLQFYDHAIDLVGPDTYRIRHEPITQYEMNERRRREVSEFVQKNVPTEKLRETALRILKNTDDKHDREEAARSLMRLQDEDGLKECLKILETIEDGAAIQIVNEIIEFMHRGE